MRQQHDDNAAVSASPLSSRESDVHRWWEWWKARRDKGQRLMTAVVGIAALLMMLIPPDTSKLRGVGFGIGIGIIWMTAIWRPGSR